FTWHRPRCCSLFIGSCLAGHERVVAGGGTILPPGGGLRRSAGGGCADRKRYRPRLLGPGGLSPPPYRYQLRTSVVRIGDAGGTGKLATTAAGICPQR